MGTRKVEVFLPASCRAAVHDGVDLNEMCTFAVSSVEPMPTVRKNVNRRLDSPAIWRWRLTSATPGVSLDAYLGSYDKLADSQDAFLVLASPNKVVLAVADGVTPTERTPGVGPLDGAQFAARCVLGHIAANLESGDMASAFADVNAELHGVPIPCSSNRDARDRPQVATVVVEVLLNPDQSVMDVRVARAADCDVWVRRGSEWTLATGTPMLKKGPRRKLARWDEQFPRATYHDRLREEARLELNDPNKWNTAALGRFPLPLYETLSINSSFDELLLVTDGARMHHWDMGVRSSLDEWFAKLRDWEKNNLPSHRQHSDVAALRFRMLES